MRHRLLDDTKGRRTVAVALEIGDPAVASILRLAGELDLNACTISGVGGFHGVSLAYFAGCGAHRPDGTTEADFLENRLEEQFEVLSFTGNLSQMEGSGEHHLHAHVVLGASDATTRGGHLVEATVRPTLELLIQEVPGRLPRGVDEKSGLVVLKP